MRYVVKKRHNPLRDKNARRPEETKKNHENLKKKKNGPARKAVAVKMGGEKRNPLQSRETAEGYDDHERKRGKRRKKGGGPRMSKGKKAAVDPLSTKRREHSRKKGKGVGGERNQVCSRLKKA